MDNQGFQGQEYEDSGRFSEDKSGEVHRESKGSQVSQVSDNSDKVASIVRSIKSGKLSGNSSGMIPAGSTNPGSRL